MTETKGKLTKSMQTKSTEELSRCILCHKCLDACPIFKQNFSIQELNTAIQPETDVPDVVKSFAFSCIQCRQCVPVCPKNLHRDEMLLVLRHKLRKEKPYGYKRYLAIRGPNLSPIAQTAQGLFVAIKSRQALDLIASMEKTPTTQTKVLFYPGCYIYSFETIRQTKRLLDFVGEPYTILGGLTTCCGFPQFLQGEFETAEDDMKILQEKITSIKPSIIITGCSECLEALQKIKEIYHESFEVYSVVEYLMKYIDRFPKIKLRETCSVQDSCRLRETINQGVALRNAVAHFCTLVEMPHNLSTAMCCYHWNHDVDIENNAHRLKRIEEAKKSASTMVCECLTCYEEFKKIKKDLEIIDVLQLFDEALSRIKKEGKNSLSSR
jgi:Fe-S oxidoreductase